MLLLLTLLTTASFSQIIDTSDTIQEASFLVESVPHAEEDSSHRESEYQVLPTIL